MSKHGQSCMVRVLTGCAYCSDNQGNESCQMRETKMDHLTSSVCITAPSLWEMCSSIFAFFFIFFWTDANKHCHWWFVSSSNKVCWFLILEDHCNSIITCTCTKIKCNVHESLMSFSSNFISLTLLSPSCKAIGLHVLIFTNL